MERETEFRGESAAEFKVGIGFGAAQAVVEMRGVEHEAQFPAPLGESTQQSNRIRAAGEADGEAHAGLQQRSIESKRGR